MGTGIPSLVQVTTVGGPLVDMQPRVNDGGTTDVRLKAMDEFTEGCPDPESSSDSGLLISVLNNYSYKNLGASIFSFGTT